MILTTFFPQLNKARKFVKIQKLFNVVIAILRIRTKFAALFSKILSYFNIIKIQLAFSPSKSKNRKDLTKDPILNEEWVSHFVIIQQLEQV